MSADMLNDDCVFCQIVSGDAPATFVRRKIDVDIIEPIGPHAPGHVLVIPTWHVQDAVANPLETATVMAEAAIYAASVGPCNIITSVGAEATQSVFHLHVHVVPRGASDGLPRYWPWFKREVTK